MDKRGPSPVAVMGAPVGDDILVCLVKPNLEVKLLWEVVSEPLPDEHCQVLGRAARK